MRSLFLLMALLMAVLLPLSGPARADDDMDKAKAAYKALEEDGKIARNPERWREVAALFDTASKGRGDGEATFLAGLSFERASRFSADRTDVNKALEIYKRLESDFKDSEFADDGLFRAARLWETLGESARARDIYRKVLEKYPKGDMAALAKTSLERVGKESELNAVRHWSGPSYTRVVLELASLTPYEFSALPADKALGRPSRIFVDLKHTLILKTCEDCRTVGDGLVTQVRVSQFNKDTTRVVLDLAAKADFRVFPLLDPARMVVDVFRAEPEDDVVAKLIDKAQKGRQARPVPPAVGKLPRTEEGKADEKAPIPLARRLKIVIDPGHGGKDPGAIGPGNTLEKDVTLKMALATKKVLEERLNCEVVLTRSDDSDLILARRTAIANTCGADLFISIHANASPYKKARGIETYYLDRASDRSARRVAAAENRTSETGVLETEQILADVILNMKLPESRRLAEEVQRQMLDKVVEGFGNVRDLGVRRAPFYVLTGAVMPAILIETAFISNQVEAGWLKDPKFHEAVANAVAGAISKYTSRI